MTLINTLSTPRMTAAALLLFLGCHGGALAAEYVLPEDGSDVVGELREVVVGKGDTLVELAKRDNIGFEAIKLANPDVDPWVPKIGTKVVIPSRYVLPQAPRDGVVLNVAEMRLYLFRKASGDRPATVITHPVGIGRVGWETPVGRTKLIAKAKDPAWYPPASIRKEHEEKGDPLPRVVPPGPDNPLGRHALRLGIPGYLIHGTNKEYGIGMRVSHGCVRMFPGDIEAIYDKVRLGTRVTIVNQPVKVGWDAGTLVMEVHPPIEGDGAPAGSLGTEATRRIVQATKERAAGALDWDAVGRLTRRVSGIPGALSAPAAEGLVNSAGAPATEGAPAAR